MTAEIEVGAVVEGEVVRVMPFGVIMRLDGGIRGLVHISQISDAFVRDVADFFEVGDSVPVKVLSVDEKGERVTLSVKEVKGAAEKEAALRANSPAKRAKDEQTLDDKLKAWQTQSNERLASINKRAKRR